MRSIEEGILLMQHAAQHLLEKGIERARSCSPKGEGHRGARATPAKRAE
jgi:hypothetical protein